MTQTLVTGGAGYFGDLLVRRLLADGCAVRVFDISEPEERARGVEYRRGDIRDAGAVRRACSGMECAFHNVAQVPLAKDRELFWSVNRDGTENLLRAALEEGVKKIVYTSSSAVFGIPKKNPVTEDMEPEPMEDYGRAKLAGEALCREFAGRGLDVTTLRPRTLLGHGRLGIFQILFDWVRHGYNIPVLGRGDNRYQFLHADDLAEACVRAARRAGPGLYHCGTDRFGTMRELLEDLCRYAGTGSRVKSVNASAALLLMRAAGAVGLSPLAAYHRMYAESLYFDISKARRELGWQPRYSNSEMLIESYRHYLSRPASADGPSLHRRPVKQRLLALLRYWL